MKIYKKVMLCCAHQLNLPYESKCNRLHGHNYKVEVWIEGQPNKDGMIADYTDIAAVINNYDHKNLNDFFNPSTAEKFAKELRDALFGNLMDKNLVAIKVRVWETPTCYAEAD